MSAPYPAPAGFLDVCAFCVHPIKVPEAVTAGEMTLPIDTGPFPPITVELPAHADCARKAAA